MPTLKRPDLPDPGPSRWWEITADAEGDYTLSLYKDYGSPDFESDLIAQAYVRSHRATPGLFESEADKLLRKVDVEQFVYVGEYFKNEGE